MHFEYKGHFIAIIDAGLGYRRIRIDEGITADLTVDHFLCDAVAYAKKWIDANQLYYYRPLKAFSGKVYKCAGHGAETPSHREFYLPFFEANKDNDCRFLPGCLISRYCGDRPTETEIFAAQ